MSFLLFSLLLFISSTEAQTSDSQTHALQKAQPRELQKSGWTQEELVRNAYVRLDSFPGTFAEFKKLIPTVKVKREEKIKNAYVEDLEDTLISCTFPGGAVDFFRGKEANPPESISRLQLSRKVPEIRLTPNVGSARKDVESSFAVNTKNSKRFELCEIQEKLEKGYEYGPACVTFRFRGDLVSEILWENPLD